MGLEDEKSGAQESVLPPTCSLTAVSQREMPFPKQHGHRAWQEASRGTLWLSEHSKKATHCHEQDGQGRGPLPSTLLTLGQGYSPRGAVLGTVGCGAASGLTHSVSQS